MIRVGIIGAGAMGRYIARLLQVHTSEVAFTAVYDPDPLAIEAATKTLGFVGVVCNSVSELLGTDCDWVMIASPNNLHKEQSIAAFEAGKHVFCQKPLATNFADCLAMRQSWLASGKQFLIGFTLRYSPHYRRIKSLLTEGVIGDIVSLEFNETLHFNHGGFIHGDWRRQTAVAGSHVLEKCCHDIDIVNWLVDSRASRVASFGGTNFFVPENADVIDQLGTSAEGHRAYRLHRGEARGEDPFLAEKDLLDNQVVILEYENETRATFHMNANTAIPERRLYICGSKGTLRADVMTGEIELERVGHDKPREDHATGASGMHGNGDPVLAEELYEAMVGGDSKNGKPASAGIAEGLIAATTCYAIDDAAQQGKVVHLESYWAQVDSQA